MAEVSHRRWPRLLRGRSRGPARRLGIRSRGAGRRKLHAAALDQALDAPSGDRFDGGHLASCRHRPISTVGGVDHAAAVAVRPTGWSPVTSAGDASGSRVRGTVRRTTTSNAIAADARGKRQSPSVSYRPPPTTQTGWSSSGAAPEAAVEEAGRRHGRTAPTAPWTSWSRAMAPIYVTGSVRRTGTSDEGLTVKYSPGVTCLDRKHYDGAEHGSEA